MNKYQVSALLTSLLLLLIFLEGALIPQGNFVVSLSIPILIPLLFMPLALHTKLHIPKIPAVLFLIIILGAFISVINSHLLHITVPYFLLILSFIFCYIVATNYSQSILGSLLYGTIILGYFLIGASIIHLSYYFITATQLVPWHALQLSVPYLFPHNLLGDFLFIPFTIALGLWSYKRSSYLLISTLLFFVAICISFSRSAYLGCALISVIYLFRFVSMRKILSGFFIVSILFLLFTATPLIVYTPFNNGYITKITQQRISQELFRRPQTYKDSFNIISSHPLLYGSGPGSYFNETLRIRTAYDFSAPTSKNIFIDILATMGWPAAIAFLGLVLYTIKKRTKNNEYFFVGFISWIALLLNMQTMLLPAFPSLLLYFFTLMGVIITDENTFTFPKWIVITPTITIIILGLTVLASPILGVRIPTLSHYIVWDKTTWDSHIQRQNAISEIKESDLKKYEWYFGKSSSAQRMLCASYMAKNQTKNAIIHCNKAETLNPFGWQSTSYAL